MNDDFEKHLKRQTPRQIPAEWREEILNAARVSSPSHPESRITHHGFLSTLNRQLTTLLWPHPKAWAGLVAVWLLVGAAHFYDADGPATVAMNAPPPSQELIMTLQRQHRELARLVEPTLSLDAEPPKALQSGPRSEGRGSIFAA